MNAVQIGEAIRAARQGSMTKIGDLSDATGTSTTTIYKLERGEPGRLAVLIDLCAALGLTLTISPAKGSDDA